MKKEEYYRIFSSSFSEAFGRACYIKQMPYACQFPILSSHENVNDKQTSTASIVQKIWSSIEYKPLSPISCVWASPTLLVLVPLITTSPSLSFLLHSSSSKLVSYSPCRRRHSFPLSHRSFTIISIISSVLPIKLGTALLRRTFKLNYRRVKISKYLNYGI